MDNVQKYNTCMSSLNSLFRSFMKYLMIIMVNFYARNSGKY
jgi:hypothetical protein